MKWFKHMSNASRDKAMQRLKKQYGFAGVGRFWMLCEMVADAMCPENHFTPHIEVEEMELKKCLGLKGDNLKIYVTYLAHIFNISATYMDDIWKIEMPNMLKLKDNHSTNLQVTCKQSRVDKSRVDIEEELTTTTTCPELKKSAPSISYDPVARCFQGITDQDITQWAEAYPAVNIRQQILAAAQWVVANPKKTKKSWRRFLTNWFSRTQERGGDIKSKKPGNNLHNSYWEARNEKNAKEQSTNR